jgi:hypothetical protein
VQLSVVPPPPGRGPPSPFIGQGEAVYSVAELMVVPANLAPGERRGESCTRPGAASTVAMWGLLVWSPPVRRLEGSADGRP